MKKKIVSKTNPFSSNPSDYIEYGYYDMGKTVIIAYIKPLFNIKK